MTKHDTEIVNAVQTALVTRLGAQRYQLWFGCDTRMEWSVDGLAIGAPNRLFLDWIRTNFRQEIERACHDVLGRPTPVEFRVHVESADNRPAAPDAAPAPPANGRSAAAPSPMAAVAIDAAAGAAEPSTFRSERRGLEHHGHAQGARNGHDRRNGADRAADESSSVFLGRASSDAPSSNGRPGATRGGNGSRVHEPAESAPARPRRRFASLRQFASGDVNRLAISSAETAVHRPGQLTPLCFVGPTAVGKTHLLQGIWSAAQRGNTRRTAVYLSAEQFTSYFIEALRGAGLPSFRRKYRGVDLLLIDDLQFFIGKHSTQVELLYTIDALLRDRRQLVFSCDRPPEQLAEFGSDFTSRLHGGLLCPVEPPDFDARRQIVSHLARQMELDLPDDVGEFIAARFTCHARAISGALCRVSATAEAHREPISLALAETALADMLRQHERPVRLHDIEQAVCEVFGLQQCSLQSTEKGQRVSHPRMLAMWLARKHTRAALGEIGRYFGRRSHSTVISAQKRVDDWVREGGRLRLQSGDQTATEALRLVERRLAAG